MTGNLAYSGPKGGRRLVAVLLSALSLGVLGVLLTAGMAQAHDHLAPDTVLKKGTKRLQSGTEVYESVWVRPSGDLCEHQSIFYRTRFPETDTVRAGSMLRVRVFKAQRPDSFKVAAYRALDKDGEPSGEARLLGRTLERVVADGKTVAWDAVFPVKNPGRDYYLVSEGHWQDREGCNADQYAFWSFHVRTRA